MSGKITVSKEVGKAIEELRGLGRTNSAIIIKAVDDTPLESDADWTLFDFVNGEGEDALISALINGYEYEKSSEDLVREYYDSVRGQGDFVGFTTEAISKTLDILGIKIEGVNG